MSSARDPAESPPRLFFDAVLHPYRSLPPRGFVVVMAVLSGASLIAGATCVLVGAWPVFGFFGVDVALVYLAFRASYRSARQREYIRLTERSLDVERVSIHGERSHVRFEPAWLRVADEGSEHNGAVTLSSHGRKVAVGRFLAPAERLQFAAALRDALAIWRAFIRNG
jgi:uncharacterized membrane protein